jgi:hypothetical protein
MRRGPDEERAGRQHARRAEGIENGPAQQNIVINTAKIEDMIDVRCGIESAVEQEIVVAGTAGQIVVPQPRWEYRRRRSGYRCRPRPRAGWHPNYRRSCWLSTSSKLMQHML